MNRLTKFEISELVAKYSKGSNDDDVCGRIREALLHAQELIWQKNKSRPEFNKVKIGSTVYGKSPLINVIAWERMWKKFDEMFAEVHRIFR